ncbi:MAG: tetratricopeptide repeat protein [Acidobacteria bacterium]|nr:tetratricopeptide repeat protein [Acidobacteriota bacterium]
MIHRTITRFLAAAVVLALAAPAAAQTGLVKGKVVGPDGKPVADAAITIEFVEGMSRKLTTKSDKRGEFVQLGLQSGGYRVTATADKLGSGFADVRVRVGNTAEVTITLSPVPPGADPKMAALKVAFDEGVAASRAQDYDTAIAKFQAALAAQPTCHECYYNIGFAYLQKKDEKQAEENWKKGLEQKADHAETLNALATLYNTQKRFDEAAAIGARAAASAPGGNADAIYNQGIILWNGGKIAEAKVKFEEAVKADPNHADSRFQLGMALLNEGKIPEAVASFEEYMKMAPTGQFAAQAKAMLSQLKPPVR